MANASDFIFRSVNSASPPTRFKSSTSSAVFRTGRVCQTNRATRGETCWVGVFPGFSDGRAENQRQRRLPATFHLSKPFHEKFTAKICHTAGRSNVNDMLRLPEAGCGQSMVLPCAAEKWRTRFRNKEDSAVLAKLRLSIFRIFRNRLFTSLEIEATPHHRTKQK